MLVLSRKKGQKLLLANDVTITVLETRGDSVKLGIQAPKHIWVYREEVLEEIRQSNQQAQDVPQTNDLTQALDLLGQAVQTTLQTIEKQGTPNASKVLNKQSGKTKGNIDGKKAKSLSSNPRSSSASQNQESP